MIILVQCLCGPERHCILACASDENAAAAETELRATVKAWIDYRLMNPWCGLCGRHWIDWEYEAGKTVFANMDEAVPALAKLEEQNRRTRELLVATGRAYDSKKRSAN